MNGPEKHYTTAEIAQAFGVTQYTVCNWVKRGRVQPDRINDRGHMRWTQAHYDQLKASFAPIPAPTRRRRRRAA